MIDVRNARSQAAVEKLGADKDGVLRKDGDKLVKRLAAIAEGVIPNTQAWITRFANK